MPALAAGLAGGASAAEVVVESVRRWTAPDHTRIVLDLSAAAAYEVRRVGDPERLAVNVRGATFADTGTMDVDDGRVLRIRRNVLDGRAQTVLDLAADVPFRHFALDAADGRPDRIVIDVFDPEPEPAVVEEAAEGPTVVVIDPGHGGMDPGAIRDGIREKDVALDIARELARRLDERDGVAAVLTRDGDWFVPLADRPRRAREAGGDLFVSIHVNTNDHPSVSGLEVYFLSQRRADDREVQELADRENAADLVGVPPEASGDDVLGILMDLRASRVVSGSGRLADQILGAARRAPGIAARHARQDVFRVLQSLAMPSVLVEVGYLSNPGDRGLLAAPAGRRELAAALAEGILAYLDAAEPGPASTMPTWATRYRVRRGDTLWTLARRFDVPVAEIRARNGLAGDRLLVGQTLTLP